MREKSPFLGCYYSSGVEQAPSASPPHKIPFWFLANFILIVHDKLKFLVKIGSDEIQWFSIDALLET